MRILLIFLISLAALSVGSQTVEQLFAQAKQVKDPAAQIELLSRVIEKSPKHVGAYHYRADAYQALGQTRKAMADYNRVVALRPKDPFRYYARGMAYQNAKEYALALADFSKAVSLNPSYENFYLARARAYRALGKPSQALADYKKYVTDNWSNASVKLLYEVIPVTLDAYQYETAQEQLEALEKLGDESPRRYLWQGRLLAAENSWDEAISFFSKAINRDEKYTEAYQQRANAFREIKDYEAALQDYSRALLLAPGAYWFNRRGLTYEEMKDFQHAVSDYTRAIELDPKWAVAYNNRGFAKLNLKNYADAKQDFETAIKLDPSAPTPYVNLAGNYWTWKKDRKQMYKNLEKAVQHHLKNFEALFDDNQKGWMFKGINHTAEFRSMLYK